DRKAAVAAREMIESIEGIDIMTPGAVAAASLFQAVASGEVDKEDCILLNISGGGVERLKSDVETRPVKPWLRVQKATAVDAILQKLTGE
ncbi:MAG: cysteate synthase, partial [Candidatus Thermoplasmatota archaeon]|nr:cysteate synthase [Candidatus Thermoplasmatota archaeon]